MTPLTALQGKVSSLDGKDYGAYQSLIGTYFNEYFRLIVEQIPKDPYAPPHTGIYRVQVERSHPDIIGYELNTKIEEIAFRDFLTRRFSDISKEVSEGQRGTGFSGIITISQPSQAILDRSCLVLTPELIEARCFLGLPANGRNIDSAVAQSMLLDELPEIVRRTFFKDQIDLSALDLHIKTAVDSDYLRSQLKSAGLVAFIAENAILPRKSGTSDKPLDKEKAIPFKSPESMAVQFKLPHKGSVTGMGIKQGITLVVGGGYHGKSTLLEAIQSGIYNHIPGDGREYCVSLPESAKVRASSGRNIEKTDISPFINNLPFEKETTAFSTENASGSTSQAAAIIEAMEIGCQLLLMDEDTCATNFMIRDRNMQALVNKEDEPITSFIDRIRQLYVENGISTILVLGGVGDYFEVSDQVVQMKQYQPMDVTEKAKVICDASSVKRSTENSGLPISPRKRMPLAESINPTNHYGKRSLYAKEVDRFVFGRHQVDLGDLEQLVEITQTKAIAQGLDYARRYMDGKTSLQAVIDQVLKDIEEHGLDVLDTRISGNYSQFRNVELAFALNRLRGLKVISL